MKCLILSTLLVLVVPTVLNAQINWTEHTLAGDFNGASDVYAIDLDDDGDKDVLGTAWIADDITWWENGGSENFTEHVIDGSFDSASDVYAIDLDDDGDIDVLGAGGGAITWWENDGSENFTEHTIDANFDGAQSVYAIDLDDDGDIDVLGAAMIADDITWWENDGDENFTEHVIDANFDGARSVYALDLDDDGDIDVLGAAWDADDITWWENDGDENFTEHVIDGSFDSASDVYALDLDDDGDKDVLAAAAAADDITWWENDGDENFTEHIIDGSFDSAQSVYALDLDDDGDIDVLGAAYIADAITWWENDGSENFTEHTIAGSFDGPGAIYAIDLDDDGDIDVLGAANDADDITWWESDLAVIDVSTISIDIQDTIPEGMALYPKATVTNFGTNTETFDVTCEIDPGAYTSVEVVTSLAPGDSTQVTFTPDFTFVGGFYTITVYTQLVGDEQHANDTLEKIIETYDPGIAEGSSVTPASFSFGLKSNPIKGKALFNLALPEAGKITLCIYDVTGRLLDKVISGRKTAGYYEIPWTKDVSSGIFFYHLDSPWQQKTGKLVLLR